MTDKPSLKLIRMHCDGELSPQQEVELQRCLDEHPDCREMFQRQVEFEKRLRECLRSTMKAGCECAPKSLCESVRAACAQGGAEAPAKASPGKSGGGSGGFWSFRMPMRANIFAVAATLMLVAGAILFGIFGRSIDDVPRLTGAELVSRAAVSASGKHDEVTKDKSSTHEQTRALAERESEADLKSPSPIPVFNFDDLGYKFIGSNACDMRLPERSRQFVYQLDTEDARKPMVSVFIVPKRGACRGMCNGADPTHWDVADVTTKCNHKVIYTSDRQFIYFLVCCRETDLPALSQRIAETLKSK
jgi:hypothetical protein